MSTSLPRPSLRIRIPSMLWGLIISLCIYSAFLPNPALSICSILSLPIYALLLWRREEPPVLFLIAAFQWLGVSTKVFHANSLGLIVSEMYDYRAMGGEGDVSMAVWLGLGGLLILSLGMWAGSRGLKFSNLEKLRIDSMQMSPQRVFVGYFLFFFLSMFLSSTFGWIAGVSQIIVAIVSLKWSFFFLLAYVVLKKNQEKYLLAIIFVFETIAGFTGFFASFKIPFVILFLVYLTIGYRFTLRSLAKLLLIIVTLFYLCVVWSAVKKEYRAFISGGESGHFSRIPVKQRFEKLWQLYRDLEFPEGFEARKNQLFERIAYVDYFARVLKRIPGEIPREWGGTIIRTIEHVTKPRLFFPSKPMLSDSEVVEKYLGIRITSETSISLGYFAEVYADFGYRGMFIGIFIIGIFWGSIFKYYVEHARVKLIGYVMSASLLGVLLGFESNLEKVMGGAIISFLVFALILRFFEVPLVSWLSRSRKISH